MYKRIVVALDGSELAEITIPYAQELALRLGSEVDVVTVCESNCPTEPMKKAYVDRIAGVVAKGGVRVHAVLLYGEPADEILDYCERNKINLIVSATHGHSGIKRWVVGSVADKILRGSTCPVLLISARVKEEPKLEKVAIKRILLPLDGSKIGESALPYVAQLASQVKAEVFLLQIVVPLDRTLPIEGYVANLADTYAAIASQAKEYLSRIEQQLKQKGIAARYEVLSGLPATSIIDYARNKGIDLVAMSTHGRSGIGRWVMGSVADKVLHGSKTPLLLVKASHVTEARV